MSSKRKRLEDTDTDDDDAPPEALSLTDAKERVFKERKLIAAQR